LGFYLSGKAGNHRLAISWLVAGSLFFYGWWNVAYLLLIVVSIMVNFSVGLVLRQYRSRLVLFAGVAFNLSLIGYYKYADFFLENINLALSQQFDPLNLILPLGISFFTFQQITYLVDTYREKASEYSFLHYCLFVTFFPQLVAGPIVHHKEMMPQFENRKLFGLKASHLSVGLTIFAFGLFKKVVFADNIAIYANPVFEAAENGVELTFFEAWTGALAYTLQLYFDFSGYSDMAIGLARMFGVVLPVNFFSPYKADNIIDFWRRWHITLSRFLRDYVYIPLGGNKRGNPRRFINLLLTMFLGGLWHGAGWTFIIWGLMHGIYLSVNHGWQSIISLLAFNQMCENSMYRMLARMLTFLSVVVAWVMFRAESLDGALEVYSAMFGLNSSSFENMYVNELFRSSLRGIVLFSVMLPIVLFAPNTIEILRNDKIALNVDQFIKSEKGVSWRPSMAYGVVVVVLLSASILSIPEGGEFLYFNF